MARLNIDVTAQNRARRELLDLRGQIDSINRQITTNAVVSRNADDVQKGKLRTDREELILSKRLLTDRAAGVRLYQAEAREVERLAREKQKLNTVSNTLRRSLSDLRFHITGLVTTEVLFGVTSLVRGIVEIGSETESARATLRQFSSDVDVTFGRLERISQTLTGIDLPDIISIFTQLRAAGAEAEEAEAIILGLTKSLTELGRTRFDIQRFFLQTTQGFSRGKIAAEDFTTIFELLPNVFQLATRLLGQTVTSTDDLKDALDRSGISAREFFVALGQQQVLEAAGADTNTFRVQTELLREEWQGFQRDLSQQVLPTLTKVVQFLRASGVAFGIFEAPEPTNLEAAQSELTRVNAELRDIADNRSLVDVDDILGSINAELQRLSTENPLQFFFSNFQDLEGVMQDLQNDLVEAESLFKERERILERIVTLSEKEADAQERTTTTLKERIGSRPRPTGDLSLDAPSATFTPAPRGPLGLPSPEQEFGGFGRRPVYQRALSEIGPQFQSDVIDILSDVRDNAQNVIQNTTRQVIAGTVTPNLITPRQARRDISPFLPSAPIVPPLPDLSGVPDEIDVQALLEDARLFRRGQRPVRGDVISDIAAFIPNDQFEAELEELEENYREEERLNNERLRRLQRFGRDLDRIVEQEQQRRERLAEAFVGIGFSALEIPSQIFDINRGGAESREQTSQGAISQIETLERDLQRRIDEIRESGVLSERDRQERITKLLEAAEQRRTDIQIEHSRRISEIDQQTARSRSDAYIDFAQNALREINKVIIAELTLKLVRAAASAVSGDLVGAAANLSGAGVYAAAFAGFGIADLGISGARAASAESQAQQAQRRFENANRNVTIETTRTYDSGKSRLEREQGHILDQEGRSAR